MKYSHEASVLFVLFLFLFFSFDCSEILAHSSSELCYQLTNEIFINISYRIVIDEGNKNEILRAIGLIENMPSSSMSAAKPQSREPLNSRQKSILISFYAQNPYPSASERHQLVQLTGRTSKQIQDWFSNRRRVDPKLLHGKTLTNSIRESTTVIDPSSSSIYAAQSTYPYYADFRYSAPVPSCPCYQCNYSYLSMMMAEPTHPSSFMNVPSYHSCC